MPISDKLELTDVPPWRRVPFSIWTRIKHWFGHHTYVDTLYAHWSDEGVATDLSTIHECWVCGREE